MGSMVTECVRYMDLGEGFFQIISKEHINEILKEYQECLPILAKSSDYRMHMAEKFSQYGIVLLLRINNKNAGFAAFYANDNETKTAYISFIAVTESFRGMHIGTKIMKKISIIAKEHNMEYVKLEVLKSNTTAQKFYKKNGYAVLCDASSESIYMTIRIGGES